MIIADPDVDPDGLVACQALASSRQFATIRYYASVESTNTAAINDLAHLSTPSLYLTDVQTAGRGRHGRSWVADQGTLTFSLVVPTVGNPAQHPPISIAVGVAIARTIEHLAAPFAAKLKWPNDVYLNNRKVAGILIEAAPAKLDAIVVGIGLNVATSFQPQAVKIDTPAIAICELTQRYPHRYQWLAECVDQVFAALEEATERPQDIVQEQRRRCLLKGHPIRYVIGDQWKEGRCEGISDDGALLVRAQSKLHRLTSGEVQQCRLSVKET
jgi:BirA family transcriptional regulator, biotin operon repressor / biotin---[acetyl-CoA-carboxylase] ligase